VTPRRTSWLIAAVALWGLLAACGPAKQTKAPAVEKKYEAGAATLTLRVSAERITVADSVLVTLDVDAPEDAKIRFPAPGEKLGEFTVAGAEQSDPELTGENRVRLRQQYELEPFLAGDYEVPPLEVQVGDQTIRTDPVKVEVASVLPAKEAKPEIKEIAPPVSLPGFSPWVCAAIGVLLAGAGFYLWWRRRKRPEPAGQMPLPHEVALRALRELMAEDLIAKGQAKLFYLRVSAILRHYIEGRFGLHAPESTTEEFLNDLRRSPHFNDARKELLRRFLHHCDMVKFAKYQPTREEIDDTVNTCAQFIAETRPAESATVSGGERTAAPAEGGA